MNASSCDAAERVFGRISAASMAFCRSSVALLIGRSWDLTVAPSPSAHTDSSSQISCSTAIDNTRDDVACTARRGTGALNANLCEAAKCRFGRNSAASMAFCKPSLALLIGRCYDFAVFPSRSAAHSGSSFIKSIAISDCFRGSQAL